VLEVVARVETAASQSEDMCSSTSAEGPSYSSVERSVGPR
jgi:hypothetical protein